jgi:4-hydroxybenzoate polyprenyltransferase
MDGKLDSAEGAARRSWLGLWLVELRPDQWLKNLVVFAGAVFGLRLLDLQALALSGAVFLIFCAASSSAYLLNDVSDRARDRLHPVKRHRPVAAGEIAVPAALAVSFGLAAAALGGAARVGMDVLIITAGYFCLSLAYTFALKHVPIVDVIVIALGFVLRAVGGAAAIGVAISPWLVLCTFMLMLFLALAKRRAEIATVEAAASSRPATRGYSLDLVDHMMTILVAVTIVSYCLYTLSPEVREKFGVDYLYATVPFVVYGVFRYLTLATESSIAENPARAAVADRPLRLTLLLWVVAVTALIYVGGRGVG